MEFYNFILYSIFILIGFFVFGVLIHVVVNIKARSKEEESYHPEFSARKNFDAYKVVTPDEEPDPEAALKKFSVKNSNKI